MKRPLLRSAFYTLLSLVLLHTAAHAVNDSTATGDVVGEGHAKARLFRHFQHMSLPAELFSPADPIFDAVEAIADSVLDQRAHAHALLQEVLTGQRFLESLDALSEIDLPVGVVKSGGALDYSILIDRMTFTKEGALMDVYVSLALPQNGARIAFHGKVPLSATGGIAGNAKVYLLGDHMVKLSQSTLLTLNSNDRTYVEFDCSGFLGVNVDAELQFSGDLIVPEDASGNPKDGRLRASFTTYTQSLHDILVQVTLPPFQVKGLRGFGFHVTKAYLDWSDLANPPAIHFPRDYTSSVIEAGLHNLWQGVYIGEAEVRLPKAFARREAIDRVAVGANQMILDEQGMTGSLYVENIFADGDMNGWKYSLEKFELDLVANSIAGLSLNGKLSIPVLRNRDGDATQFLYTAQRAADGTYLFAVEVEDELKLDLWAADLNLAEGSSVVVAERNNTFYPAAHLSGELTINLTGKGPKARFNSLRFEDMVISSEAPHFVPGTFGFGREGQSSDIAKYPVVFDNITIKSEQRRVGIAFDLMVNISGKPEEESFAGKGGLVVWGIQDDDSRQTADGDLIALDRHSWKFDRVELTGIKINIRKPNVIDLAGEVRFYDEDPAYGEGFKGSLRGKIQAITVQAEALFGRTETFRYWYADALVKMDKGIPVVPGVLSAFGFGGGYYCKMAQSTKPLPTTLGKSPSGITYIPDENAIGIRAIVLIGTPRPEAMNGDVSLEVSINRHGGVNSITFTGNANFMSAPSLGSEQITQLASAAVAGKLTEKLESLTRGQVYGSVRLHFDNLNDIFHGNLEVYVNVAGGIVRGVSKGNKAGWAVLHFEKKDWYIHIGTPDQPLGLEVARIFKSKSYFMLGKNLPGSPPPPSQVSEILGNIDLDYMRDMNALESGMGIAFGLHFLVDTGDLRFLMFYGRFSAGTGLDFMLKDYGNEYHCAGSSGPMGINGWYANGQAYAFVMGNIGIKVNLRFYKGTYDILSIGAAAVLQAKGPNPFWMKGTVGGYYKILGGLVKGKCRFEVTVGKECRPVAEQDLLAEVNMIAEITPQNLASEVSVFNTPQIAFNIPVGEIFQITDLEKNTHYFRAVLDEFTVTEGSRSIQGKLSWNTERDVVIFDAVDLLPGEKKLKARARLTFEQKINGNWLKVKFAGKTVVETAETKFETGKAPDFIPPSNIACSYPLRDQQNFFPDEHDNGVIQLIDGQPYLFRQNKDWIQKIRITDAVSETSVDAPLTYNTRMRQVSFTIPGGLENSRLYRLEIVNVPRQARQIDDNVTSVEREIRIDQSAGSATLTTQSIQGQLDILETKPIFQSQFRTSKYNTFPEKMRSVTFAPVIRISPEINVFQLTSYLKGDEHFETSELGGSADQPGLIQTEAILEGNGWYEGYVYPLVYEGYPLLGWMKVTRPEPDILGVPPIRDVYYQNVKSTPAPGPGNSLSTPFTDEFVVYNLGQSVTFDFRALQRHAVNYLVDQPAAAPSRLQALALKPLPALRYGSYRIKLSYVIPGINKTTSSFETELFNRIPDNDQNYD